MIGRLVDLLLFTLALWVITGSVDRPVEQRPPRVEIGALLWERSVN